MDSEEKLSDSLDEEKKTGKKGLINIKITEDEEDAEMSNSDLNIESVNYLDDPDDDFTDEEIDNVIKGTDEETIVDEIGEGVQIEPDIRFGEIKTDSETKEKKKFKDVFEKSKEKESINKRVKNKTKKLLSIKNLISLGGGILTTLDFILNTIIIISMLSGVGFSIYFLYHTNWVMVLCSNLFIIVMALINREIK